MIKRKKFKIKLISLIFTTISVLSIVSVPAIFIGMNYFQKKHPDRVPFDLYTPLPSSWYVAGDINVIQNEIFNKQYTAYKEYVKDEDLPISFARLSAKNLNTIKDFYEQPILDLNFDLDYSENPQEIKVNIPAQLDLSVVEQNVYNPQASNVIANLGRTTLKGFSYQVINSIYRNIYIKSFDNLNHFNSYLYNIDKDIERSRGVHKFYRIQVWRSSINDLKKHSDGKSLISIGEKLKNIYNYMPVTTATINRGYQQDDMRRNIKELFIPHRYRDVFCYAEANHDLPINNSQINLIKPNGDPITDKKDKKDAFHKSLRYLCTPIKKTLKITLINGNVKEYVSVDWNPKQPSPDSNLALDLNQNLIWNISNDKFHNAVTVANYLKKIGIAWFHFQNNMPANKLILIINDDIVDNYNYIHINKITQQQDWYFSWQQVPGNNGQMFPWWVVEDMNIDDKKSFPGQYFEGFLDNTWEESRKGFINCSDKEFEHCKVDPTFNLNWDKNNHPIQNQYFVRMTESSMVRRYETFDRDTNKSIFNNIISGLKSLLSIGNTFIHNNLFVALAPEANLKLGQEFLDILRTLGGLYHNIGDKDYNSDLDYWDRSIEALKPYIESDSGINWYSWFSDEDVANITGPNTAEIIKELPFMTFLNFFVSGKPEEKRIKNYLINGFMQYNGFVVPGNILYDFNALPVVSDFSHLEIYSYVDNRFGASSVNAGGISLIVKYLSLIIYNYKILQEKPLTMDEKIDNLNQMLWNTYILNDTKKVLHPYYHTKDSNKKSGYLTIDDLETELSIEPFRLWLKSIFGHQVTEYK